MSILKKSNNIVLESCAYDLANASTLLAGSKNNGFAIFLNDYNLLIYILKAFGLITLISTWTFIAIII